MALPAVRFGLATTFARFTHYRHHARNPRVHNVQTLLAVEGFKKLERAQTQKNQAKADGASCQRPAKALNLVFIPF